MSPLYPFVCNYFAGVLISSSTMDPKSKERVISQEKESATSTLKRFDCQKRLHVTRLVDHDDADDPTMLLFVFILLLAVFSSSAFVFVRPL